MNKRSIGLQAAVWLAAVGSLGAQSGPPRVLVFSDNPVITKGLKNQGVYANGTAYLRNDVVLVSGVWYVSAVDGNIGNPPASNPSKWLGFSVAGTATVGPAGPQGLQGIQGIAGPAGPAGAAGVAGAQGPAGVAGAAGVPGAAGAQGPAGVQGGVGPQGPIGATGAQGLPGIPGTGATPGQSLADTAVTGSGTNDGIANLLNGICAAGTGTATSACDIVISPAYSMTEVSRYFSPAKAGNDEQYVTFPVAGGISRPRFALDSRLSNRYFESINPRPLTSYLNNDRTPFVFEVRTSNSFNYADNVGAALFKTRMYDGHNYTVAGVGVKQNFLSVAFDGQIRAGGQGGGFISSTLSHPSAGDDMVFVVQHDSNGCAEHEDECSKLWRAFVETMTARFGGTLNATPVADTAGFGNYAMTLTVGSGYNAQVSGTDNMTVNLSQAYTTGNVTHIQGSPYPGTAMVTGDAAANWAAQFGASVITTLTAPIDARHYNTSCPSTVTDSSPILPNPFLSDESGIGGMTAFCGTVASTAGITAGQRATIAGTQGNIEMVKVVQVIDGTHLTLNASNPHDIGELLSVGGAQGYGISLLADDIAPNGLFNYYRQPSTALHKFLPIVGSDSSGHLYVYTNEAKVNEWSTMGYQSTTPLQLATIGTVSTSGTAVTAVNLSNPGNYQVDRNQAYNYAGLGYQSILAAPTLIWTGCTTAPTTVNTLAYGVGSNYGYGLQIAVTNGGNCPPGFTVALSTTWTNPYRIAPLVMAKKVVDPSSGVPNGGYLLTGALDPAKWQAGNLIEQPGWMHDVTGSQITFGKYYTGASRANGIQNVVYFAGDWANPDILNGFVNQTDGHKYYADAAHPIGPGVAYELPPDGFAMGGDYGNTYRIYTPPMFALFDIACGGQQLGNMSYHPCVNNIPTAYNLFSMHSTSGENFHLRYDPTFGDGRLGWDGTYLNPRLTSVASSCNSANGGTLNYLAGAAGAKDVVQVCAKDASDSFAWRTIY